MAAWLGEGKVGTFASFLGIEASGVVTAWPEFLAVDACVVQAG